ARRSRALRAALGTTADGELRAHVLPHQQPHRLASLGAADALVLLPPSGDDVPAGTVVEIVRLPGR
ncbi:molybdopterin molybdenumtransferase MoeA, partial [Patulibacter sp. S7RM1-6]